jgi:voltage-gated sodium channel
MLGKSDPYLKFLAAVPKDGKPMEVWKTEVIINDLNPLWKPFAVDMHKLCDSDLDARFMIECWDQDVMTKGDMIGWITTTVRELLAKKPLVLNDRPGGKTAKPGSLVVNSISVVEKGAWAWDDVVPLHEIIEVKDLEEFSSSADFFSPDSQGMLSIHTASTGHNKGRKYCLQIVGLLEPSGKDESELVPCDVVALMETICALAASARKRICPETVFMRARRAARQLFKSSLFQTAIALLICANFVTNALEAQMSNSLYNDDGSPSSFKQILEEMDLFFTIVFLAELALNMYAHLLWEFLKDGWCIFDTIVVMASLFTLVKTGDSNATLTIFRMLRAFRVIRIFGRLRAIRSIINALTNSLIPVMNAFFIMGIVICLYAIIGVTFYGVKSPESFGNLERSIISMFRIAAGETWVEGSPIIAIDGTVDWQTAVFVMSFVIVVNWTLLQVSVAVLLDNFISETAREKKEIQDLEMEELRARDNMGNVLDPLIKIIAGEYIDDRDLSQFVRRMFVFFADLSQVCAPHCQMQPLKLGLIQGLFGSSAR